MIVTFPLLGNDSEVARANADFVPAGAQLIAVFDNGAARIAG